MLMLLLRIHASRRREELLLDVCRPAVDLGEGRRDLVPPGADRIEGGLHVGEPDAAKLPEVQQGGV